jgi:hypothetical protein
MYLHLVRRSPTSEKRMGSAQSSHPEACILPLEYSRMATNISIAARKTVFRTIMVVDWEGGLAKSGTTPGGGDTTGRFDARLTGIPEADMMLGLNLMFDAELFRYIGGYKDTASLWYAGARCYSLGLFSGHCIFLLGGSGFGLWQLALE